MDYQLKIDRRKVLIEKNEYLYSAVTFYRYVSYEDKLT